MSYTRQALMFIGFLLAWSAAACLTFHEQEESLCTTMRWLNSIIHVNGRHVTPRCSVAAYMSCNRTTGA